MNVAAHSDCIILSSYPDLQFNAALLLLPGCFKDDLQLLVISDNQVCIGN